MVNKCPRGVDWFIENSMDCIVHGVTKSWTRLSFFQFTSHSLDVSFFFNFFNDTATTEIYTLSLHDALPIWIPGREILKG